MKKRVFIVHEWAGGPNTHWYQWLKKELEARDIEVHVPPTPHADEPTINDSVANLKEVAGTPEGDTYFVGHSIGCQIIMRYLEGASNRIGGAVFAAGWFNLKNLENEEVKKIARPWIETPIDFDKVKENINRLTVILSSNDPYNYTEENKRIFEEKLGAKVIIIENAGHFTKDDGFAEFPAVLKELKEITK